MEKKLTKKQVEAIAAMAAGVELWSTSVRGKETFALTKDPFGRGVNVRAPLAYELMSMGIIERDTSPGSKMTEQFYGQGLYVVQRYRLRVA